MSYDIDVFTVEYHFSRNYTSNVSGMYYKAFERVYEDLSPILEKAWYKIKDFKEAFNSREREIIIPTLKFMIADMRAYPDIYKPLNPKNGWGNYEGAIEFLEEALKALLENKNSVMEISW